VVWGKTAENCAQYLAKGRQVYVEGSLQTRDWEDREGKKRQTTEVRAYRVQFLGTRGGGPGGASAPPHSDPDASGSDGPPSDPSGGTAPPSGQTGPSGGTGPPSGQTGPSGGGDDIPF
jgi:single-strand DNA-binding protein